MVKEKIEQKSGKENVIFVGTKPIMSYVNSVAIQFTKNNSKELFIKARGKFTSKAIDITEIVKKKFSEQGKVEIANIKIDSSKFNNKEGKSINISTIEIKLTRK